MTMLCETTWTKPKPQRQERAEREDVHDILQDMQDLRGWPAVGRRLSRRVARRTCRSSAREAMRHRFSVRRRPGKIKDKEKARPSTAVRQPCFLIVTSDKVGKPTGGDRPEARSQASWTTWQSERYGIMGT